MRVAVVHSYYDTSQPSGETLAVDYQVSALQRAGHEVQLVSRSTDTEATRPLFRLRAAHNVITGRGYDPTPRLDHFRPDVVHIHNWFPNIGTSWLTRWRGPVVATVHNFRPMCAAGTLYREGASCTLCTDGSSLSAVRYACYHDSRVATVPLAVRTRHGVLGDPILQRADKVICLSNRSAAIYRLNGLSGGKIEVVPNFVVSAADPSEARGRGWVFVGRLTPEKGLLELLDIWPGEERLDIIGGGPLEPDVRAHARGKVRLLGRVDPGRVNSMIREYEGVVVPSRSAEGATTNVMLEALDAGRPVVAARGSGAADETEALGVGAVYDADDATQLREALATVRADGDINERCVAAAKRFSEANWVTHMTRIYASIRLAGSSGHVTAES